MNRRHFLGQVVLGSAAIASRVTSAHAQSGGLTIKFVGMMGFVGRSDKSILVAVPGHHPIGHYSHTPFLMARSGSAIADALGLARMPGVVAGAFDDTLTTAGSDAFVYRCLDATDVEVNAGVSSAVLNRATHLAQMSRIAPGKRLRSNLRRWAHATVSLQGGQLDNASAHPDAGKVWSIGAHQQPLTDAVTYHANEGTIRVAVGSEVRTFTAGPTSTGELWVVSAAGPRSAASDPKRLEHGAILFEYLVDAAPLVATCAEAEGRITMATELPCATTAIASRAGGAATVYPPFIELCFDAYFGDDL